MELLIDELVEAVVKRRIVGQEEVMDAGFALLIPGTDALHVSATTLLLSVSCVAQIAMGIAGAHRLPGRRVPGFDEWRGKWRALGSLGSPTVLFAALTDVMGDSPWPMIRDSSDMPLALLGAVREMDEDEELIDALRVLIGHAASAPTLDERKLTMIRWSGEEGKLSEAMERISDAISNLIEVSEARLRAKLRSSGIEMDMAEQLVSLWWKALTTAGSLQGLVELTSDIVKRLIDVASEMEGISKPSDMEIQELRRTTLLVVEAMPAAALMSAVLYRKIDVLRQEMVIGWEPELAIQEMLDQGVHLLDEIEDSADEAPEPCGELIRYWHQELMEWTVDHVATVHTLLGSLYLMHHEPFYNETGRKLPAGQKTSTGEIRQGGRGPRRRKGTRKRQ